MLKTRFEFLRSIPFLIPPTNQTSSARADDQRAVGKGVIEELSFTILFHNIGFNHGLRAFLTLFRQSYKDGELFVANA
jgi:hypothetical protein